ncbi:MAG: DUF523 and DUF1722 domain-containing protein [Deltaproteobacteria bacterium]|nr:DUF523 and DUF1722 domain-containing protein [Deltaproteobacteria bacterium]
MIKVGVSSCLLGEKVRYDGGHKHDKYLTDNLGKYFEWVSMCPERVLGVPRESMHLVVNSSGEVILSTVKTGKNMTQIVKSTVEKLIEESVGSDLCGFIFKKKSPSCGMERVKIYNENGFSNSTGSGLFAQEFIQTFPFMPVEEEGRLNDPEIRINFLTRVFVFAEWKKFISENPTADGLYNFHAAHKYLLMASDVGQLKKLGGFISGAGNNITDEFLEKYIHMLLDGLKKIPTKGQHVNVLQHIAGYFKKLLTSDEKKELMENIMQYREGILPLSAVITLLKHYVRKYKEPYLARQYYLYREGADLFQL